MSRKLLISTLTLLTVIFGVGTSYGFQVNGLQVNRRQAIMTAGSALNSALDNVQAGNAAAAEQNLDVAYQLLIPLDNVPGMKHITGLISVAQVDIQMNDLTNVVADITQARNELRVIFARPEYAARDERIVAQPVRDQRIDMRGQQRSAPVQVPARQNPRQTSIFTRGSQWKKQ